MSEQKTRTLPNGVETPVYTVETLRAAKLSEVVNGTANALSHIARFAFLAELRGDADKIDNAREMATLTCDRLNAHLRGDFEEALRLHEKGVTRITQLVSDAEEAVNG